MRVYSSRIRSQEAVKHTLVLELNVRAFHSVTGVVFKILVGACLLLEFLLLSFLTCGDVRCVVSHLTLLHLLTEERFEVLDLVDIHSVLHGELELSLLAFIQLDLGNLAAEELSIEFILQVLVHLGVHRRS